VPGDLKIWHLSGSFLSATKGGVKMKDKDTMNPPGASKPSKKTYHQPELLVYGNLSEITQTVGVNGVFDNGLKVTKTHL
jgi:hypothetical protein